MKILQRYALKLMPAFICLALVFSQALGFKHYYDHSSLLRNGDLVEQTLNSTNSTVSDDRNDLVADSLASTKNKIVHSCIALDSVCFGLFAVSSASNLVLSADLIDTYLPPLFQVKRGKNYSAYLSRAPPKNS